MANNNTELKGWAKYCKEQNIEFSTKRIFIDGLGGMAHGLFASLLIGCIINTIGMYVPLLKDIVVNPWGSEALAGANLLIASKTAAYAVHLRRFDQSCGAEGRAGYRIHFGRLRFQHLVNNCNRLIVVGRVLTVCVQDIDRCKLSLCDRNGYIDLSAETCSAASRI